MITSTFKLLIAMALGIALSAPAKADSDMVLREDQDLARMSTYHDHKKDMDMSIEFDDHSHPKMNVDKRILHNDH